MFAEIIINENVEKLNTIFDYEVPKELEKIIKIGNRVSVPFKFSKQDGYVINLKEKSDFKGKFRSIKEIISEESLSKEKMKLAQLISKRYFCNLSECIKLFLNPMTNSKNIDNILKEKEYKVIEISNLDEMNLEDIKVKVNSKKELMLKYIIFLKQYNLDNNIILKEHIINLGITSAILKEFEQINVIQQKNIQLSLDEYIDIEKNNSNIKKIFLNMLEKYTHSNIKEYIDILKNIKSEEILNEFKKYNNEKNNNINYKDKKILNEEQKYALEQIEECINKNEFQEFLLFGVTGSGKTEVYLQTIEKVLAKNKNVVILVPEISLTSQMEDRFKNRFGDNIHVMHSKLSTRKRFEEWNAISKKKNNLVVLGTRSAIFAPIENIGAIIVDEEHDFSYKSDKTPKYDAKEIARYIAKNNNAVYILGSATPLIETMYQAKELNKIKLLTLTKRATENELPNVQIVDMRNKNGIFSDELINKLVEIKNKNKQSLIFLNRRGFSSSYICKNCGHVEMCPNCNINLTYHKKENLLKCHYCGYATKVETKCKMCGSESKILPGMGTQKLEEELIKKIPDIKISRMDHDTTQNIGGHEKILNEFVKENKDVLIGTQMIVKGHHFANVTFVSVLLADNLLNQESYRATETAFQTLVQVIGRSGREEKGEALIQTYSPEHYVIELAKNNDYLSFYNIEIDLRKKLKYPPFTDIIIFKILSKDFKMSEYIATKLEKILKNNKDILENKIKEIYKEDKKIDIFNRQMYKIEKINNQYRWKIVVKCNLNILVINWIDQVLQNIELDKNTKIYVELNPFDI